MNYTIYITNDTKESIEQEIKLLEDQTRYRPAEYVREKLAKIGFLEDMLKSAVIISNVISNDTQALWNQNT
jgi:hypothetical protein